MKKYDIAHSELTNCYYIMCDGKKVAECTEQIANIRADAFDRGYDKGRADKYREITSEYMLLTEKQVAEIRADAIEECITFIKEHSGEHYIDCDGYCCAKETVFNCDDWLEDLRDMKEQKE